MNVLWIVNTIFPFPAEKMKIKSSVFGGWLFGLFNYLRECKRINKIIVAATYNCDELLKFEDKNIIYYIIPCKDKCKYDKKQEEYWKNIANNEKIDVVHIHGTEFPHSLCYLNSCGGENVCVSIQGLVSVYGQRFSFFSGVNKFPVSFADLLKRDTVYLAMKKFQKRGIYEEEALKKCKTIIGRTSWDKSHAYKITGEDKYEKCNESLRSIFYKKHWDLKKIERHSIFISQASYPIKGFHKVLEAASILKRQYVDLKIYVAGEVIIKNNVLKNKIKISGYALYLKKLIKKYNLQDNVIFTGLLNEEQMCDRLLKSNVFVQASSIENSPNSLGEAMLIGMPCVASYVGGTADMLLDKTEGFLYPFNESSMLAYYISGIFENDQLAVKFGDEARKHALVTHDLKSNGNRIVEIYEKISKNTLKREIKKMKITFFSNYLNHHQLPFCLELFNNPDVDFKFVATEPVPDSRIKLGYDDMNNSYDFVVRSYEDEDTAFKLGLESDVVIIGSAPSKYISKRLKFNKLTFRYSERIYKEGFNIRTWLSFIKHYSYKERNVYLLCSSAYAAHDYNSSLSFLNRTYKWGYFPNVFEYDIDNLLKSKINNEKIEILWVGRFLNWKHPEKALYVADMLNKKNIDYSLKMIGIGDEIENCRAYINQHDLGDKVLLLGAVNNKDVRAYMNKANIFLFTSDYNEGWGAVLNESMNSGCTVIASHAIGSVPFVLRDNYNGLIYDNDDINDLYNKVLYVINDRDLQKKLGYNAYMTMINIWNAKNASKQLIKLINNILFNKNYEIEDDGPCSKALSISNKKMYEKLVHSSDKEVN